MQQVPTGIEISPGHETDHTVWDRWLRLFHWGLALSIATALFTGLVLGAPWIRVHLAASIIATLLVVARVVWGFTGPTYARFSQFKPTVYDVKEHLNSDQHHRHIGHNPVGALMVFALIGLVVLLAVTGVVVLGGLKTGPLASMVSGALAMPAQDIHGVIANGVLILVILHLGGVIFESRRSRENLARSMVTGRKAARPGDITSPLKPALPKIAMVVIAAGFVAATGAVVRLSQRTAPHPPVAAISSVYDEECSACHMLYHPSLRPAASWQVLMSHLNSHFGEDASLPADTTAKITTWLTANSADSTDSKPAALWRGLAEKSPVALPDTPQWQDLHEDVDPALFRQKSVLSRSNCAACHQDAASGWFSPFSISVPKE